MSSPNINNIINLSCLFLYLCPIFNSIKGLYFQNESLANLMCQINTWILPLCSTAIYAAMLAKAWRIFKIFDTTPKIKKVVIRDMRLVVYIFCMILVDLIILIIWHLIDTVKLKSRYVYEVQTQVSQIILPPSYSSKYSAYMNSTTSNNQHTPITHYSLLLTNDSKNSFNLERSNFPIIQNSSKINQLKVVYECNSNYNEVWVTVITMYKIILLMYGIYLAWIIRNINVPSMNDSKYLFLSTYSIVVCGLGSMTLMQLLRDWPDVVQAFFTIGVILTTCTTQCLLFIPKIRLWYKRRNDDNFKISLSQIFLQSTSSCYFTDKFNNRASTNSSNANIINLEDELCELLHENSQLKNYLKEKEEIIKLLQDKIRVTKATLYQVNEQQKKLLKNEHLISETNGLIFESPNNNKSNLLNENSTSANNINNIDSDEKIRDSQILYYSGSNQQNQSCSNSNEKQSNDTNYEIDSSTCTVTTTAETIKSATKAIIQENKFQFPTSNTTEQLKNDLDEVEELTTRVRDSISVDLSNTRRYSPLLYEYYRNVTGRLNIIGLLSETYNIQCNSLFDAMTLMRNCLKDYCQTVHNPEYLAIDEINNNNANCTSNINNNLMHEKYQSNANYQHQFTFNDYVNKNNLHHTINGDILSDNSSSNGNINNMFSNKYFHLNPHHQFNNASYKPNSVTAISNRNLKQILHETNPFGNQTAEEPIEISKHMNKINSSCSIDNKIKFSSTCSSENTENTSSTSTTSTSSLSVPSFSNTKPDSNSKITSQNDVIPVIDNKQTYV